MTFFLITTQPNSMYICMYGHFSLESVKVEAMLKIRGFTLSVGWAGEGLTWGVFGLRSTWGSRGVAPCHMWNLINTCCIPPCFKFP